MNNSPSRTALSRPLKWFYLLVLFALVFSGFGQMPIFKRYYLADLPGLAWTADYYVTLVIHYLAAASLLGLIAYYLVSQALRRELWPPQDGPAWVRAFLLLVMLASGSILAARNLSWVHLPPRLIVAATLTHVTTTMVFLLAAATYFRFGRRKA